MFGAGKPHCILEICYLGTPTPAWYFVNSNEFDQYLRNNADLPRILVLSTLGNIENLKDNHVYLHLSLVWHRKIRLHIQKFAVFEPIPQSDIRPNSIKFHLNLPNYLNLPSKLILPTLGNTDNVKDKHDCLYLSMVWSRGTSLHFHNLLVLYPYP